MFKQAAQLRDGLVMQIDAQVDPGIGPPVDDLQRR
jgi:hypothetical protein